MTARFFFATSKLKKKKKSFLGQAPGCMPVISMPGDKSRRVAHSRLDIVIPPLLSPPQLGEEMFPWVLLQSKRMKTRDQPFPCWLSKTP